MQVSQLSQKICGNFNQIQLRNFCLELGVDYEQLSGDTPREKAKELIRRYSRRQMLPQLLNALQIKRPSHDWTIIS